MGGAAFRADPASMGFDDRAANGKSHLPKLLFCVFAAPLPKRTKLRSDG